MTHKTMTQWHIRQWQWHSYQYSEIPVSSNNPALAPAILSPPATISKAKGETAKFHCLVQHLGKDQSCWPQTSPLTSQHFRRPAHRLEEGLQRPGHGPHRHRGRLQGQHWEAQRSEQSGYKGHLGAGCRRLCVPGETQSRIVMIIIISVSDLCTEWYSLRGAQTGRTR